MIQAGLNETRKQFKIWHKNRKGREMNLDDKIGTGLQMNRDDMDMI